MKSLKNKFSNRQELIDYVKELSPWSAGSPGNYIGGIETAKSILESLNLVGYKSTRNFGNGKVTRLSPYISHGILSLNTVRNRALSETEDLSSVKHFIQELSWRDFWQKVAYERPKNLWEDLEPYKTGFAADDYSEELPQDIRKGETDVLCINQFIHGLIKEGYLHNHARMYIASYVVHFRRIKWQAGAQWFLEHLMDGDEASNNFSWQWVASTFSNKPYIFNLANITHYFDGTVNTDPSKNKTIDDTYEKLSQKLFPQKDPNL